MHLPEPPARTDASAPASGQAIRRERRLSVIVAAGVMALICSLLVPVMCASLGAISWWACGAIVLVAPASIVAALVCLDRCIPALVGAPRADDVHKRREAARRRRAARSEGLDLAERNIARIDRMLDILDDDPDADADHIDRLLRGCALWDELCGVPREDAEGWGAGQRQLHGLLSRLEADLGITPPRP